MRTITMIVIHCSAVRPGQRSTAADIDRWHKAKGWKCIGYHYVVRRDGTVERGRTEEQAGAHVRNHNKYSIGVCYEGGLDDESRPTDTRTPAQKTALLKLLTELHRCYPKALILGHHDLDPQKACPCFPCSEYRYLLH